MNDKAASIRTALCAGVLAAGMIATGMSLAARADAPRTVYFPSADGRTELVGYLFEPTGSGRHPAIVLLHGRAGPYSSNVNHDCTQVGRGIRSPCSAATLSKRHQMWGEYWVEHGYVALLVDSFGPRGRGHGYASHSHDDPDRDAVNERTVRPLDAEGALAYLRQRNDVRQNRIMLQGWSNGASTTLNVMERQAQAGQDPGRGFRAALAFYPGCGPAAILSKPYRADTDLWVFLGSDDEEVSPKTCAEMLHAATTSHGRIEMTWYEGATHDFDDPGKSRQSVAANRIAMNDALHRSAALFESLP
jgi:carboxymethylenebutenolidase